MCVSFLNVFPHYAIISTSVHVCLLFRNRDVYPKASPSAHWNHVGNSETHRNHFLVFSGCLPVSPVNSPTLTNQRWYQNTSPTASYIFKLINITTKTNILVFKLYLSVTRTPRSDVTAAWQTKLRAQAFPTCEQRVRLSRRQSDQKLQPPKWFGMFYS